MDDTIVVYKDEKTSSVPSNVEDPAYDIGRSNATLGTTQLETTQHSSHGSVHTFVWIYIAPVIFVLGLCGNILIMCVMSRPKLRGSSATVYLPLMAFFDTLVLITGIIPEWLEAMGITILKETHPATCKLEKFLFYSTSDTAIWLLVLFTFDRFIAVCFPLRKTHVCRPRKAVLFSAVAFMASCTKNVHVFWTRGAEQYQDDGITKTTNCGKPNSFHFESYIRPWIAFVAVSIIPFIAILTFNVGIVRKLIKIKTRPVGHSPSPRKTSVEKQFSQATIMCLSASFMFLLTITPSIVILIGKPYWTKKDFDYVYNEKYAAAKAISNVMVYLNHSLTFFLYCMTGRRFREELLEMFKGRLPHHSSCKSQLTTASTAGLNCHVGLDSVILQRSNSFASVYQVNIVLDKKRSSGTSTNSVLYPSGSGAIGKGGYLIVNGGGAKRSSSTISNV